jgi:hypothetical protein
VITDRDISDVERALILIQKMQADGTLTDGERTEFFAGLWGCYNVSDLNRVESKVEELSAALTASGYPNAVNTHVWAAGDILTDAEVMRYLGNISALRAAYYAKTDTPDTPDMSRWIDYVAANDIERILVDIAELIAAKNASSAISGTFYSGARRALPIGRD